MVAREEGDEREGGCDGLRETDIRRKDGEGEWMGESEKNAFEWSVRYVIVPTAARQNTRSGIAFPFRRELLFLFY